MTDMNAPIPAGKPALVAVRGDARTVLAGMPDQSADCIVTCPPYSGKRDYGVAGQYGHEDTPAAYVETMRKVQRGAPRPRRRRHMLAQPRRLLLGPRRRGDREARLPRRAHHHSPRDRDTREEPARPPVAGRVRPAGRRLDPPQRDRVAQAQRDARIGTRPAQLPSRAAVPARQVARLLVRPRPDPRASQDREPARARYRSKPYPPAG